MRETDFNCWLCGARHVSTLPSGCVPELWTGEFRAQAEVTLCPGCALSNRTLVIGCAQCEEGLDALAGCDS